MLVAGILLYTIFPFYWAIAPRSGRRRHGDVVSYWPDKIYWGNLEYVFENGDFVRALLNSAIVSVGTVIVALTLGSFAAYAMGRMKFRGRTASLYIILAMTMFPSIAILGSLFK